MENLTLYWLDKSAEEIDEIGSDVVKNMEAILEEIKKDPTPGKNRFAYISLPKTKTKATESFVSSRPLAGEKKK